MSTIFLILILLYKKYKKNKNYITEKQKLLAETLSNQMKFMTTKEQSIKICKIFNINSSCIKKSIIFYKNCAIIPLFNYEICNNDILLNNFIKIKNEKIEKVIFITNLFDSELNNFKNYYNDIKICLLDKYDFYKVIEPLNIEIKAPIEIKTTKKENLQNLLTLSFNKTKSKGYFLYGIILFICCLFFRYNIYYIIFSSLMFSFCIFSRFNKRFNRLKSKNSIDIAKETLK